MARHVAQTHWAQWHKMFGGEGSFLQHADEEVIRRGMQYLANRFTRVGARAWAESAERTVAAAFAQDMPLTAMLSMTGAGASETLQILGRRHACSEGERARINEVFLRLRSLECDIYASLYAAYVDYEHASNGTACPRRFASTRARSSRSSG
jgi:methyl-accepting chemotaxis protein